MSIADRSTPMSPAVSRESSPRQGPITLAMYDRMITAGVFDPAEIHPLELIGGELHMMSPIGARHADAVDWLVRWSMHAVEQQPLAVRVQNPLSIPGSESAPQPDLAWVTLRRYADRMPGKRPVHDRAGGGSVGASSVRSIGQPRARWRRNWAAL